MPKKKSAEIVRKLKTPKLPATPAKPIPIETAASIVKGRSSKNAVHPDTGVEENVSPFPPTFENKAGHYELIRIDGDQAYYSFTNHQQRTVDATMSVTTWRKMQERALAAYKETA